MNQTAIPESLKAALDFEQKGKNYYTKAAAEVADALSRKLFETLAEDEARHAERIQELFTALSRGQDWPESKPAHRSGLEQAIRDFFRDNRGRIVKDTTHLEGYEFAMQMEKTGIELYTKFAHETLQSTERAFFQALIREEQEHLEALSNVYFYLTQTGDWLQEDESKRWNWMNV